MAATFAKIHTAVRQHWLATMDINISYGRGLHPVHVPAGSTVADVKAAAVAGPLAPYAADFGLATTYKGAALPDDTAATHEQLYVVDPPPAQAAAAAPTAAAAAPAHADGGAAE